MLNFSRWILQVTSVLIKGPLPSVRCVAFLLFVTIIPESEEHSGTREAKWIGYSGTESPANISTLKIS